LDSADLNQLKDQIKKSNKAGIPVLDVDAVWIPGGTVLRFVLWWG
jgi:ABC-type sugar transport system substrate-binding protein